MSNRCNAAGCNAANPGRRRFLTNAGLSLAAAGAAPGLVMSAGPAGAAKPQAPVQTRETQAATTPARALQKLKDGNDRFVRGDLLDRDYRKQVLATGDEGQFPFAAVVGCVDSRAPAEVVFDQGVGDIFNARVAGNFVNDDMLGSLEFACAVAGAKLIVVLGHNECGAVKGAADDVVMGNLTKTLANLKPAVAAVTGHEKDRTSTNPAFVQAVAEKNVHLTVDRIRQRSPILREMIVKGEVGLVGAMYDIRTGRVTFL